MNNDFMAFVGDEGSASSVRVWAEKQGFPPDTVRLGGADLFTSLLENGAPPKIALVDLDHHDQPIQVAARLVSLCGPATKIIALGSANDVHLYRNMLAAGLTDYLVKPLTAELLTQAMLMATREKGPAGVLAKEGKNIVIIGTRGGVGTSTLATNLAWIISHEMKKKTALLDLDLQFGTSALALDLEPGHGLRDIVSSPSRVDALMISGAMIPESDKLSVLSAEEPIDDAIHVDPAAIAALLKELRSDHAAILIDLPRHLFATQKRLLATANDIILVTEMSLIGIRDTLRMRTILKGLGTTARISIVATKIGPNHQAAVDEAAFAKGAGAPVDYTLPDDPKDLAAASNAGKMLGQIAAGAPLTKMIRDMAARLMEGTPEKKKEAKQEGFIGHLLSGLKEKKES